MNSLKSSVSLNIQERDKLWTSALLNGLSLYQFQEKNLIKHLEKGHVRSIERVDVLYANLKKYVLVLTLIISCPS